MQQTIIQESDSSHQNADNINDINLKKEPLEWKSTICLLYRRGYCQSPAKDCNCAHGIIDLKFKRIDPNIKETDKGQKANAGSKPKGDKNYGGENEEEPAENENNEEREPVQVQSPYINFYEYQFVLKERGEVDAIYSLTDVYKLRDLRHSIRDKLYRDLQREFVELLYREYNTKALKKSFVQTCFMSVNWRPHWRYIIDKDFCFEARVPQEGLFIIKYPKGEDFDCYMEDRIVKIVKDQQLLSKAPINPTLIGKLYHQYLGALDPYKPNYLDYLKYRDFKTIDDYLDRLQNTESFVEKLAEAYGKSIEEISLIPIFDHTGNEMQKVLAQMKKSLFKMIDESSLGFIMYSKYEDRVILEYGQKLQQFNISIPKIKKLVMRIPLQENILIVNLGSATYLFSLDKYKKANLEQIKDKYYKKLYSGCTLSVSDHIVLHQLPEIKPEPTTMDHNISNRQTKEFLEKEIDLKKVVVVDDEESLIEAIEHLSKVDAVGVDLEGNLSKNGGIELLQCASRSKIFIFDVYKVKKKAKEDENNIELYKKMSCFLKNMVEDSKICKIFHDGRKDSLALHVFLDACPSNVFDLSATYMLIEHLEIYKSQKSQSDKAIVEETKVNASKEETKLDEKQKEPPQKKKEARSETTWNLVGDVKLPGLNDVLERYQATHGPNKLKEIMKGRFGVVPREYFLQRPIDKEFLIYSARDVEDLIEIKEKMEQKLREALLFFVNSNSLEEERVDLLCKKISKSYSIYGCLEKD